MEITPAQFALIEHCLPLQRGNVSMTNLQVVNALLYVAEHGCKWRGLPERFGNWHTVYTRINRWAKSGVLDRMFAQLQTCQIVRIKIEAVSLDSTSIKVHPDGTGALKNLISPIPQPWKLLAIRKTRSGQGVQRSSAVASRGSICFRSNRRLKR
ncbi:ISXoo12 transposase [Xanthomonas oryzae pv. oryzae MAFF 311018]|nr:ISXoo12 transposase [Xanthomonas oryzae pv. oryzae MAFF 311018]